MAEVIEYLKGKKTYIIAGLIAVVTFLQYAELIDAETAAMLFGLLGAGGAASLRAGVKK